jgi:hypothetical protein
MLLLICLLVTLAHAQNVTSGSFRIRQDRFFLSCGKQIGNGPSWVPASSDAGVDTVWSFVKSGLFTTLACNNSAGDQFRLGDVAVSPKCLGDHDLPFCPVDYLSAPSGTNSWMYNAETFQLFTHKNSSLVPGALCLVAATVPGKLACKDLSTPCGAFATACPLAAMISGIVLMPVSEGRQSAAVLRNAHKTVKIH